MLKVVPKWTQEELIDKLTGYVCGAAPAQTARSYLAAATMTDAEALAAAEATVRAARAAKAQADKARRGDPANHRCTICGLMGHFESERGSLLTQRNAFRSHTDTTASCIS